MKSFDESLCNVAHAPLAFRRSHQGDGSETSCVEWLPSHFTEGVFIPVEAVTEFFQNRGADRTFVRSRTLLKLHVPWISQNCFHIRDVMSKVPRCRSQIPSPQTNELEVLPTSLGYYVDVNGDSDWDPAGLNAADDLLDQTVSTTKLTELQESYRRANLAGLSSTVDVAKFARPHIHAPVTDNMFYNDRLRRSAGVSSCK